MTVMKFSDRVAKSLMVLAALWAFMLCFFILADVIGRGALNAPVNGVREIVANSIVMIVFLQASYAIRSRAMLRADFLVEKFPPLFKRLSLAIGYILGFIFFAIVITGGVDLAIHSWVAGEYEGEGAMRVPSWPTRFMILIGAGLACVNYVALFLVDVLGLWRDDEIDVASSGATH